MSNSWSEVLPGIWRIDVFHSIAERTCCYLLVDKESAALIDCGAKSGIPSIMESLDAIGVAKEQIQWIIATHAHMDHVGAAGELLQHFPNAVLAGHESGLTHLISPDAKLIPAVRSLFGEKFYTSQYADIIPAEESRTKVIADNDVLMVGDRKLNILYTPGHAWHHVSIYDEANSLFYAGDAYGTSFAEVYGTKTPLIAPVMPPNQFNPQAMCDSLVRLKSLNARHVALTHFGIIANSPDLADKQIQAIEEWVAAAEQLAENPANFSTAFADYLKKWYHTAATNAGYDADAALQAHATDIMLSVKGFQYLMERRS